MKQIGTVIELRGNTAKIECNRQSACDMCENASSCIEKCKKVHATAVNEVNASVGDIVEIETDTGKVLINAFTVFMLPIFLAVLAYFGAVTLFGEGIAVIITFGILVVSLVFFSFILNKRENKKTVSRIVKILQTDDVKK